MAVAESRALDQALTALAVGRSRDPFAVLGPHPIDSGGFIVRAYRPAARAIDLIVRETGERRAMTPRDPAGVFEAVASSPGYRLRITYGSGVTSEADDPYR